MDKKDIVSAFRDVTEKTADMLRRMLHDTDREHAETAGGHLTARERITNLFDENTFVELGAYIKRSPTDATAEENDFESVICGYGAVCGRLVYAFAQDFSRNKGAVSERHAEKVVRLYRMAVENGAPVVGIFDSAGAQITDGVRAMSAYGKMMNAVASASGVIPQIALVPGISSGSAAVLTAMFDFTVSVKDSGALYVNSPALLKENGNADYVSENGLCALKAENENDMIAKTKELLSYLPANAYMGVYPGETADSLNRPVHIAGLTSEGIIREIADQNRYLKLSAEYAPEMIVAFAAIGDITCGVIANNREEKGGMLSAKAARKAARFVSFCDAFNLPVISLVDSCGLDESLEAESSPYALELAKLSSAIASATTPIVSIVLGEAYGVVYNVMGSLACGADIALAIDSAKISPVKASTAVAFLWNDKIGEKDEDGNEYTRASLEVLWNKANANPVEAAYAGAIDDIIPENELRQRIIAALEVLDRKTKMIPDKRHSTMPL